MSAPTETTIPDETTLISQFRGYRQCSKFAGKIAIIGFGKMGALHATILKMLNPEITVIVVEQSRLVRIGGSTFLKGVKFYRSVDKMLAKEEPHVAYVTTPAVTHFELLSELSSPSSSVDSIFVEKPPTRDSEQLSRLLSGSLGKGRVTMVGLQKRFALPFRHLKQLIDAEALGTVESVGASIRSGDVLSETTRFDDLGRGCLLDLGIHLVDLITWLFGRVTVSQVDASSIFTRLDDEVNAELQAGRAAVDIKLSVTWSSSVVRWPSAKLLVRGSRGVAEATEDTLKLKLEGREERVISKPTYYGDSPAVNLADPEFTFEDMHFFCCANERSEPETSLTACASTMALIDEIYSKMRLGQPDTHRR